ncbi:MAG: PKD domain-containing protein [Bacteroidetes bacterium]|nr:PKD domain-containing protein [Bacteroidota bacterium]
MACTYSDFTISPSTTVNVGDVVTFTNTSTIGLTYNWDFGDGTNSAVYSPTHSYAVGGTYNVTLTVTSPAGCIQTITQQVNVFQCASAAFTATSVCQNTTSTVTFTGVYLASTVFTWNFGSGTVVSGSGSGPYTISWATPGTYQIDVSVDGGGCATASASQQVTIYQVPVATVSNDAQVCNGAPANVTFTGTAPAGAAYTWNFSGGNAVGSAAGPYDVTWNTPGTYPVDLIVSANGCADTISTSVIVNAIPTSNFNATPTVCLGSPVTVNFTGTAGGTATYNWNFGGGTVVSGSGAGPYTLIYNTAGSTNVSLTVDENGCTSMPSSQAVVNNPIPNASINATPALCTGASNYITFNGTATGTATYNWTFGSGTVASGSGAGPYSVSWNAAGQQVLSVIVLDEGCTDTAIQCKRKCHSYCCIHSNAISLCRRSYYRELYRYGNCICKLYMEF